MRKTFKYFIVAWLIGLIAFNLFIFVFPTKIDGLTVIKLVSLVSVDKAALLAINGVGEMVFTKYGGAFWTSYTLVMISFVINLICSSIAFKETNNTKFLYNFSLVKISYSSLVLTTVLGLFGMFIPNVPNFVVIIACGLVIAINLIACVGIKANAEIVVSKDEEIKVKTSSINELVSLAETNYRNESDPEKKKQLKKVYEALKFSDPVSNDSTRELEEKIKENLLNIEDVLKFINKRNSLLRNQKWGKV